MQKSLNLIKNISKQLNKDWLPELESINLHRCFEPLYEIGVEDGKQLTTEQINVLICCIVYGYDNESKWIDLKQDGYTINKNILIGLGIDSDTQRDYIYTQFIEMSNENINTAIGNYLDLLTDWRFVSARKMIAYHSKYIREEETGLAGIDEDKKIKARENIGKLIKEAITQRTAADQLILLIEKDFVTTNHSTENNFGVKFTDSTIKRNIESWSQFIKHELIPMREKQKLSGNSV